MNATGFKYCSDLDSILKITLISHFQNKTGLSRNTSMFQIKVGMTILVKYQHESSPRAPMSHVL